MSQPDWPDKTPARREAQRAAYEDLYREWRYVLQVIEEKVRHPSPEYPPT